MALWDHPRIRGEKAFHVLPQRLRPGSPPHTRGKDTSCGLTSSAVGITPAYAGKSGSASPPAAGPWDHPRIRGEKCVVVVDVWRAFGSPPHARGKAFPLATDGPDVRITPAYAGKSGLLRLRLIVQGDHPRIRGEKFTSRDELAVRQGSPPHTRGKGGMRSTPERGRRITPAYAGKS